MPYGVPALRFSYPAVFLPCISPTLQCSGPAVLPPKRVAGGASSTHLVLGQGFQVLQDLSHHRLTELAVLSQELGVSPVQAVIGVNWFNKQEQHVTWDWQMAGRPGREYGNGQGDPLTLGFTKKTPSLGPSLGLRPTVWKSFPPTGHAWRGQSQSQ